MKTTGFTFVRNALLYDYPVVEAILSILPICDHFVVAVGNSTDGTLELIQSIKSDKITIVSTVWDDTLRTGGVVLAHETDKAYAHIPPDTTWAFYIQADEVIHQQYLPAIQQAMHAYADNIGVEGLLFKYLHFYGSYNFVADARRFYRQEVRIVRYTPQVFSYKDAQGFRKKPNQKLKVKAIDAYIYHYGWAKEPLKQLEKQRSSGRFWHNDHQLHQDFGQMTTYDYANSIERLRHFHGTHPDTMQHRVAAQAWAVNFDVSKQRFSFKNKILNYIEKTTGWRIGEYKNFKKI
jgi:hypothetical protein